MAIGTIAGIVAASIAAGGAVGSSLIGAHAAGKAADQQASAANTALDFQKGVYAGAQENQQPYVDAGQTSIAKLMEGLNNGTFGPGSIAPFTAPASTRDNPDFAGHFTAPESTLNNPNFKAPTAAEAAATPGYEFTLEQGLRGVGASAAARGGALSGANIKASDRYAQGLASTTYNDTFNHAVEGYKINLANQGQIFNQGLAGFDADLASYKTNLANHGQVFDQALAEFGANQSQQAQQYGQLSGVAALGQSGIQSINNTGTGTATNVGNLMAQIGNAQAAGTVGSANAIGSGITSATGGIANAISTAQILKQLGSGRTPPFFPESSDISII